MRVTERQDHQLLQSVQIQNLLEIANPIPRQVQILQWNQWVQPRAYLLNPIISHIQLLELIHERNPI